MSDKYDLVLLDQRGDPVRIGPWPKQQAENLARHQRQWHRTIGCADPVRIEPHIGEVTTLVEADKWREYQ